MKLITNPLNIHARIVCLPAAEVAKAVVQNEKCKTQCQSTAPSSAQVRYMCKTCDRNFTNSFCTLSRKRKAW